MRRREFLRTAAAGLAYASALRSAAGDGLIEVLIDEPIATIAPEIYGHFVENLGGVVYDGIWVGENSAIPNIGGLRKQLVDALRRISPPVIRWPGGCFRRQLRLARRNRDRGTSVPSGRISGRERRSGPRTPTAAGRRASIRTSSAPSSSRASARPPERNLTSRPTCAGRARRISTGG